MVNLSKAERDKIIPQMGAASNDFYFKLENDYFLFFSFIILFIY